LPKSLKFGEITTGNKINILIDGYETFNLIFKNIAEANSSIYFDLYDMDPNITLESLHF